MNKLLHEIQGRVNRNALTANGATSLVSSMNNVLDFFSKCGSIRNWDEDEVVSLFGRAFSENSELALKALFYCRDVRGGIGERKTFYSCLKYLAETRSDLFTDSLFDLIPDYGKWEDLFALRGTKVYDKVLEYIAVKFNQEIERFYNNKKLSLLAKYMPSVNAGKESRKIAQEFLEFCRSSSSREIVSLSERDYRKILAKMRKVIGIVEVKMCERKWGDIDYSHVPSQASRIYRKAFCKHDETRYKSFLTSVEKGESKINASTLYPYDLVRACLWGQGDQTIEALWKALPNYVDPEVYQNGIVVCDTSGSMTENKSTPLSVAISLSLYFAERNKGDFANKFISFSSKPYLVEIVGKTLREKVQFIRQVDWQSTTNIQAVFDLILDSAVAINCPESDMPKNIFIISDMQFNECASGLTNFEDIAGKYEKYGYRRPNLIFWDVNSGDDMQVTCDQMKAAMISGFSPVGFKQVASCDLDSLTPISLMKSVLNSDRYVAVEKVIL